MQKLTNQIRRFTISQDGPTAVEYAVMLSLVIAVLLLAIRTVGTNTKTLFQNAATSTAS